MSFAVVISRLLFSVQNVIAVAASIAIQLKYINNIILGCLAATWRDRILTSETVLRWRMCDYVFIALGIPTGSGRVEHITFFKCSFLHVVLSFFLPFSFSYFLLFFRSPRGNLFRTQTSSEPTFFDANFRVDKLIYMLFMCWTPRLQKWSPKRTKMGSKIHRTWSEN